MAAFLSGVVKAVLSGDTVVVVGSPKNGPPPEKVIKMSSISAPQLGWKDRPDEPFAWAAREALRKKCIGKPVTFKVDSGAKATGPRKDYGEIWMSGVSLNEWVVSEGWAKVRSKGPDSENPLKQLEAAAEEAGKGIWTQDAEATASAVRTLNPTGSFDAKKLFKDLKGKPVPAIVDQVRDGSTLRLILLPDFHYITLFLAGVRCPGFKRAEEPGGADVAMPFAPEAKYFTEIRLLNRDVEVVLEKVDDRGNFVGTLKVANGNIAEVLVKEGLANVVESTAVLSDSLETLRKCEAQAKKKKLRLFKNWAPPRPSVNPEEKHLAGVVVEVSSADSCVVRDGGKEHKVFLSSIRVPRLRRDDKSEPWAWEAKEFLRKRLIGKNVKVEIDYIKEGPETNPAPRRFATVHAGGKNVAVQLVLAGLATAIYHKPDEERSPHYDDLVIAQAKAEKQQNGQFKAKAAAAKKFNDVSRNVDLAKILISGFEGKRLKGIVDFVVNGARFKITLLKDELIIPFVLEAVRCPRYDPVKGSEEFGSEAYHFARGVLMQREVDVVINSVDRGGSFVGNLFVNEQNFGVAMLREGLGYSNERAMERSDYSREMREAEEEARAAKKNYWSTYKEPVVTDEVETADSEGSKKDLYDVVVTEVVDCVTVYAQVVGEGTTEALEKMMDEFRAHHESGAGADSGPYEAEKGKYCSAKFSADNQWYRAKVLNVTDDGAEVLFVDFGNSETVPLASLAPIPAEFLQLSPQARVYSLAFLIKAPEKDEDILAEALDATRALTLGKTLVANVEYKQGEQKWVSLFDPNERISINAELLALGVVRCERRRERQFQSTIKKLLESEDAAKDANLGLWFYGDIDYDEPEDAEGPGLDRPKKR